MLVRVSVVWVMVKVRGAGEGWPGADTLTDAVPAVAMRLAETVAVSCVLETNEVVSGVPFQVMFIEDVKPVPFAVNVKAGPPAAVVLGESLVRVNGSLMLKVRGW